MTVEQQKKLLMNALFYGVLGVVAYFGVRLLIGPLLPFVLAAVLAFCLQGAVRRLCEKFRFNRTFAAVFTFFVLFGSVMFAAVWLVRVLYRQLTELISALPRYSESISAGYNALVEKVNAFFGKMPDMGGFLEDIPTAALTAAAEKAASALTDLAARLAQSIPSFLLSLTVTVIAGAYLTKDFDKLTSFLKASVPHRTAEKLLHIKNTTLKNIQKLLKGYIIIIALTFSELLIGLWVLNIKYALVIALVTALVDILPVLGSGTVLIPWAAVSALTGDPSRAIGLVILYIIITAVRNIAEPKIIGSKLGVHPVLMLASVFVGLRLFGAMGILLAPVAVIVIKSILTERFPNLTQIKSANGE